MTRYEKTMQGLKCCSYASKRGCEDCPYLREQIEGCIERCTMSLATDALELLKELEPKKVRGFCGRTAKFIDADALATSIYDYLALKHFYGRNLDTAYENLRFIVDYIKSYPTVDVTPVVRCKNCAYCTIAVDRKYREHVHSSIYQCDHIGLVEVEPNWFCADGKKKEGKTADEV